VRIGGGGARKKGKSVPEEKNPPKKKNRASFKGTKQMKGEKGAERNRRTQRSHLENGHCQGPSRDVGTEGKIAVSGKAGGPNKKKKKHDSQGANRSKTSRGEANDSVRGEGQHYTSFKTVNWEEGKIRRQKNTKSSKRGPKGKGDRQGTSAGAPKKVKKKKHKILAWVGVGGGGWSLGKEDLMGGGKKKRPSS